MVKNGYNGEWYWLMDHDGDEWEFDSNNCD